MIEIRDVTETDYTEWLRLFDLYLQFYNSSLPEEVKKSTFYRSLDYNVPMWSAIAISSETGRPIGLVNYLRHVSTWSTQYKIYMNDLYVDESQLFRESVKLSLIMFMLRQIPWRHRRFIGVHRPVTIEHNYYIARLGFLQTRSFISGYHLLKLQSSEQTPGTFILF